MTLEDLAFPPTVQDDLQALTRRPAMCDDGSGCATPFCPCANGQSMVPASESEKINTNSRNVLALDLGTHTGWALRRRDGTITHGTESFSPRKSWTPGQRWLRYRSWLSALIEREQIHAIAYELVHRHLGTEAAHAYGAFQALTEMSAEGRNIELLPVGVGVIKQAWTGSGKADKAAMIAEARRRGFRPASDNAADALAILHWAIDQENQA